MVGVTVLAVVLFAVPLGLAVARIYRGREVSRLQREAMRVAGAIPGAGTEGTDPVVLPRAARRVRLTLYDTNGRLVAGAGPTTGHNEVDAALRGRLADDHDGAWLAVAVPMQDEEHIVGAARAATPWKAVTNETYTSWLVMAAIGGAAVVLAGVVARRQADPLVAPVDGVAELAVKLGAGDFTARLDPSGVPELDRATEALNRTAGRLADVIGRERSFTADVSHQLNTPLTSLRQGLESALATPGADTTAAIEQAITEVDRLHNTVTTLLAVTRDASSPGDAACDAAAVCKEAAERGRGQLAAQGRPMRTAIEPDLPLARCPGEVLAEILAVLVDNATVHGAGAVTMAARRAGTGVVIDVGDEGEGLCGEVSELFRRRSSQASGHGIGLALARSLAEAHNGRLMVTRARPHPVFSIALAHANGVSAASQSP